MSHTLAQYKDSIAGLLSGMDLSVVDNLDGAIERAARVLVQNADIPEASGIQNITLYAGVIDYPCDARIFGSAINDIAPQGITRRPSDFVYKQDPQQFDRLKEFHRQGTMATFQWLSGSPIIRIVTSYTPQQAAISPMSDLTGWNSAGSLSSLALDTSTYYHQPASLRFTLTGNSTGSLSTTLQSPLSISSYQGVGVAFLAIEIPTGSTASDLASISLRLGSDTANYNQVISTAGFLGTWTTGNFILVAFDFASATTVGSPDWSSIQYVDCIFTHSATITNFRAGGLWIALPVQAQILYQSAAIFMNSAGVLSTTITDNTDTIILNDAAYTIFEYEGASSVCQQTGGTSGSAMIQTFNQILNGVRARNGVMIKSGLYDQFRANNPSQQLRQTDTWYDTSNSYNGGWY